MKIERLESKEARLTIYPDGPDWNGIPTATIGDFACNSVEAGMAILSDAVPLAGLASWVRCPAIPGIAIGSFWNPTAARNFFSNPRMSLTNARHSSRQASHR